jgi:hypothetical protein
LVRITLPFREDVDDLPPRDQGRVMQYVRKFDIMLRDGELPVVK